MLKFEDRVVIVGWLVGSVVLFFGDLFGGFCSDGDVVVIEGVGDVS